MTGEQFGRGRSSREVWLRAKAYLYVCETCGDETWQTGEGFFHESYMIYNNSLLASWRRGAMEVVLRLRINIQEPENNNGRTITLCL